MTDQNTAGTTSNNVQTPWVNRFGTLANVSKRTTKNGKPMVAFTLIGQGKAKPDGTRESFEVKCVAYGQKVMDAVLAAGNGQYISLRGPMETFDKSMDGGKYTQSTTVFKAAMVNEKKAAAAGEAAPAAGAASEAAASSTVQEDLEDQIPF